jgi:hypothetical protein
LLANLPCGHALSVKLSHGSTVHNEAGTATDAALGPEETGKYRAIALTAYSRYKLDHITGD